MKSYKQISFNLKPILLSLTICSSFVFYPIQSVLSADICSEDEKSSEIEELCKRIAETELKTDFLEAEKGRIDAERAIFKLNLPDTGIDPVEGKIKFEDLKYESTVLAYGEMAKAAEKIGNQISTHLHKKSVILIYPIEDPGNDRIAKLYMLYLAFHRQHQGLIDAYRSQQIDLPQDDDKESVAEPTLAAGSLIKLAQLFQVEQNVEAVTIEQLTNQAVAAQIFKVLKQKNKNHKIYYPNLHFYDPVSTKKVVTEIIQLLYLKEKGKEEIAKSGISETRKTAIEKLNQINEELLKSISVNQLNKIVSDEQVGNVVIDLAKGAKLFELFDKLQNPYILYVKVITGGSNRTTRSIFGSKLRHSGGVIVNYQLNAMGAEIIDANYVRSYSGFRKVKETSEPYSRD